MDAVIERHSAPQAPRSGGPPSLRLARWDFGILPATGISHTHTHARVRVRTHTHTARSRLHGTLREYGFRRVRLEPREALSQFTHTWAGDRERARFELEAVIDDAKEPTYLCSTTYKAFGSLTTRDIPQTNQHAWVEASEPVIQVSLQ